MNNMNNIKKNNKNTEEGPFDYIYELNAWITSITGHQPVNK